jgi:hypothetical protein
MNHAEELRVVVDPMEDGGAEGEIGDGVELKLKEVALNQSHALAEAGELRARGRDHAGGGIHGNHAPAWQPRKQFGGEASGAAAQVERALVAPQLDGIEHPHAPAELRVAHALVGGAVPVVSGSHAARITSAAKAGIPLVHCLQG